MVLDFAMHSHLDKKLRPRMIRGGSRTKMFFDPVVDHVNGDPRTERIGDDRRGAVTRDQDPGRSAREVTQLVQKQGSDPTTVVLRTSPRREILDGDEQRPARTQRCIPRCVRIVEDVNVSRVFPFPKMDDLDASGLELADQVVNVLRCSAANLAVRIHVPRIEADFQEGTTPTAATLPVIGARQSRMMPSV